jgi:nitrite reductase (NO-forming)
VDIKKHPAVIGTIVMTVGLLALAGLFASGLRAGTLAREQSPAAAGGDATVVDVELGDLYVKPGKIEVAHGQTVRLRVTNHGAVQHDLKLEGQTGTQLLSPGQSQIVDFGPIHDTTSAWCTVPGHKAAGMVLQIVVSGTTGGATQATTHAGADRHGRSH